MPITEKELQDANKAMLGNTNRAILFTTVNLSASAPRLEDMLAYLAAGVLTWEQFNAQVKEKLTVRSFAEFIDKFQPCYYYRLRPPEGAVTGEGAEDETAVADVQSEEGVSEEGGAAEAAASAAIGGEGGEPKFEVGDLPYYEFSLEGGPPELGWKKVVIGVDHPYFRSLQSLIKERALMAKTTFQTNVDAALFGFKPRTQQMMVRKGAQDLQAASDKLMLEMRRNPDSSDTRKALEAYDRRVRDLENALGDDLRVLPTVTHGLAEARKALGAGGGSGQTAMGEFVLALGEGEKVVAKAKPRELMASHKERLALTEGQPPPPEPSGTTEIVLLQDALQSRPLAKRELREIATLPKNDQFPAVVGSFMSEMVRLNKIDPMLGNMVAVVLQDPKQLAMWNVNPQQVEVFHDTFLGIYSNGVENFLKSVTPLFETVMGIYMLFNEFPPDVRRGQPELIVANGELTDLWQVYQAELVAYLRGACHQAANQFKDAISFAIVPSVTSFQNQPPASPPSGYIRAGDFISDYRQPPTAPTEEDRIKLDEQIEALRHRRVAETGGFGRVTGAGEVLGLMELGKECGFQVFFSPEEKVIAGRTRAEYIEAIQEQYCPSHVVDKDWAVCGVLCLPDFVCLPPDGVLLTGKVMDGRDVGVDVPQVTVRSCYVAAGRYMSNDAPEVLQSIIGKLPQQQLKALPMKVRPNLPGLSVDLTRYTVLGQTRLPVDHFLDDALLRQLLGRDKSFLVFSQVSGISPNIAAPRTLRRVITPAGDRYVFIHHYRQQIYLQRLILAAYHLGFGGALPSAAEMTNLMDRVVNWMGWYDVNKEGYVNAFPSELEGDKVVVEPIVEGGETIGFNLNLPFRGVVLGELQLTFS